MKDNQDLKTYYAHEELLKSDLGKVSFFLRKAGYSLSSQKASDGVFSI